MADLFPELIHSSQTSGFVRLGRIVIFVCPLYSTSRPGVACGERIGIHDSLSTCKNILYITGKEFPSRLFVVVPPGSKRVSRSWSAVIVIVKESEYSSGCARPRAARRSRREKKKPPTTFPPGPRLKKACQNRPHRARNLRHPRPQTIRMIRSTNHRRPTQQRTTSKNHPHRPHRRLAVMVVVVGMGSQPHRILEPTLLGTGKRYGLRLITRIISTTR